MSKVLNVGFDNNGNLYEHAYYNNAKMEIAVDFDDILEYVSLIDYYRSSSRVKFKSLKTGRTYTMMLHDFHEIIASHKFTNNTITGRFKFVKKGTAQSIKMVKEIDPNF